MSLINSAISKKVLIVAAHPDDEVLGCGGTIARHTDDGDEVHVVFMADGVSSREDKEHDKETQSRKDSALAASKILGVESVEFFDFPDNRMDTVAMLDIVKKLEKVFGKIRPSVVYTHFCCDLNIDHRVTHQAVMTVCRPLPKQVVREIYSFEIPSSTGWLAPTQENVFIPHRFVNVINTMDRKIEALNTYKEEIYEFPHFRSIKGVVSMMQMRGASVGVSSVESFMVLRQII